MEKIYIQKLLHELKELEILKDGLNDEIKKYENKIKEFMTQRSLEEVLGEEGERVIFKPVISKRYGVDVKFDKKDVVLGLNMSVNNCKLNLKNIKIRKPF